MTHVERTNHFRVWLLLFASILALGILAGRALFAVGHGHRPAERADEIRMQTQNLVENQNDFNEKIESAFAQIERNKNEMDTLLEALETARKGS
jgi:hypothetical protein